MQKDLNASFKLGLRLNVWLTRSRFRILEAKVTTPLFVALTTMIRGRRRVPATATAIAREWERQLGGTGAASFVGEEEGTAYGEIRVHCPLRGTGDVEACHRLMAYDRRLVGALGGQFVVLESQAEPGKTQCRVALRPAHVSVDDLVPAHRRTRASTQ